mmetsp:Transcript_37217/g.62620  ORF Transcript_37217/g.62620 Transcript_37217/m.62620 type:complete len:264 (-) Transcript_37217:316-1107(-)|eukprot:CAMPEP_0198203600 /NCGR_PEP_ID=MMETSP1445-20131203/6901_1 /TAXON_ID=36898 /ORGANISM="Pyramimonas sp., Strain CCMP2087" /LENGTH=263 /DNA_ID=CAMNT_0043875055 /DNA_START=114 /DNA_END=905 /DNA_ORIENTATION=-
MQHSRHAPTNNYNDYNGPNTVIHSPPKPTTVHAFSAPSEQRTQREAPNTFENQGQQGQQVNTDRTEGGVHVFEKVFRMCASCPTGGNKLTLTSQRMIIETWQEMCFGTCTATVQQESFDYPDLRHFKLNMGRNVMRLYLGLLFLVLAIAAIIVGATGGTSGGDDDSDDPDPVPISFGVLILLPIGIYFIAKFFLDLKKAIITLEFSKNVPVGSWMTSFSGILDFFKFRDHSYTSREVMLSRADAEQAVSIIQGKRTFFIAKAV